MCLILFALDAHPEFDLVLAANRDEMLSRPTAPAAFWRDDGAEWFGGRDLDKGGTWLGLTRSGRFAALTNVRDPAARREGASRGWLVRDALTSSLPAEPFARAIDRPRYPAFNLLVHDLEPSAGEGAGAGPGAGPTGGMFYAREDSSDVVRVAPGFHGLSNHRLDTYWPKVELGLRGLSSLLARPATPAPGALFDLLRDRARADDAMLPHTGVPLEIERGLSPAFIRLPGYGTRCSTVVMWHRSGAVYFEERSWDEAGALVATVTETLQIPQPKVE